MTTTALHIVELVKSLPVAEQKTICAELTKHTASLVQRKRHQLQRLPDGKYFNPEGIPEDDPFFKIMEEQETARSHDPGPPAPEFN